MEHVQTMTLKTIARTEGFAPLWASQCLLSFNDNCFKILVSMVAVEEARRQGLTSSDLPLVAAAFLTPFLLFSGIAGRLADTTSKAQLLRYMKVAEVVAMLAGTLALAAHSMPGMLAVVFLMGMHSTFYGPARAGLTPELVGVNALAGANGLLDMGSYFSIVLGTLAGTLLHAKLGGDLWQAGAMLTVLAVAGLWFTLRLPKGVAASVAGEARLIDGLKHLVRDKALSRTVAAIASFWFLGGLMQMLVLLLAKEKLNVEEPATGLLLAALAVGIGAGSALAGRLSSHGIELGLLPLGGFGIVAGLFGIASAGSFEVAVVALFGTGLSAGLWIVPLDAYLQFRTKPEERGRVVGASSFVNTVGTLAAPALLWVGQKAGVSVTTLLYVAAAYAVLCTVCAVVVCRRELVRFAILSVIRMVYRIDATGAERIPSSGGALIVANHVTFVDGLLLSTLTQRNVRFLVIEKHYRQFEPLMRAFGAIAVNQGRPRDVVQMIARSREALMAGDLVCIFPEGDLTHTGNMKEFQRGMEKIVEGLDVPVIPMHLGGMWGSIFSFEGGKFFYKRPKQIPYPVRITVGDVLPNTVKAVEARQAVMELSAEAAEREAARLPLLHQAFLASAKRQPGRVAVADSTGKVVTYREALVGSLLLARRLAWVPGQMVGVILPASVGGALVNVASLMAGKPPVNLNFTSGREALDSAVKQCGIESIITSRAFLAKARMEERRGMVFVEDLLGSISKVEKAAGLVVGYLPEFVLRRMVAHGKAEGLATVVFSSGSSGEPKGVMLSHANVMSNIAACDAVVPLDGAARIAGVLPFFHSFGFTFTLWFPLVKGIGGVYQMNPLDAKGVGTLVEKWQATVLLGTPTFLANYTKVVPAAQFRSLKLVLAGAEKLREGVVNGFAEKFGVTPREGYGATEMSPVIAVSGEDVLYEGYVQRGWAAGSVGRPLPGVAVRVVDPESRQAMACGEEGLLLVRGANLMMGYLGDPVKTRDAMVDGWYVTGDVAKLDEQGFIYLTGRLSRFSKIAGEMVPHGRVEEAVDAVLGEGAQCCVVGLPDADRGEKLVLLYEGSAVTPAELAMALGATPLPKLWLPKRDAIVKVDALPMLGTGKLDLRQAKSMAEAALLELEVER